MILNKKVFSLIITLLLTLPSLTFAKTTKRAEDVFKKWIDLQEIMPDKNLASMTQHINDDFVVSFKNHYEKTAPLLASLTPFLDSVTLSHINDRGYTLSTPIDADLCNNLAGFYELLQHDVPNFINLLKDSNILSFHTSRAQELGLDLTGIIEKYQALFGLLFAHPNEKIKDQYLFAVANQFYEYCFDPKSFNDFQKLHLRKRHYPITRMLYATMWLNLAGNGWKNWHQDSLNMLKECADQGRQIVYIAGGSDLYQLIKAGVYNIKNIDPQLPSQPKYYTDEWQFLLQGDIGDTILFTFDDRIIIMERTNFAVPGSSFRARIATGEIIEIAHSITTWAISDHSGNKLGEYILERRFCQQSDFISESNKTLLMSFNELYFICLPGVLNGWNIEPSYFDQNLSIVVKQLRKPVSKQMAVNMRIASLLNITDFKFIALGTCIN